MTMSEQLKPLCVTLDDVLGRLAAVECQLGITPSKGASAPSVSAAATPAVVVDECPRLAAYDEHMSRALTPFADSCTALGSEMDAIGKSVRDVWNGIRIIVELGTHYKKPSDPVIAIQPHLKPCQTAMSSVRAARLDRKFDWHLKAIMETLACASWVCMTPPPAPCSFVKETVGASDFWANKVRKEYKNKGEEGAKHSAFCNAMKALVLDLSAYVKEYHLSGLAWNPHGRDFADARVGEGGSGATAKKDTPSKAPSILAELKKKQASDGSSAASGLKKVSRDQQTWRKEFKKTSDAPPKPDPAAKPAAAPKSGAKKALGSPKCEYQTRGCKWNVENQTKDTCEYGVCKITVSDPKQQVYIFNCHDVTIQITGKLKSVVLDGCTKCGVVFDTAISACEVVNCKRVQVQATNVCPSFSIDKTDGIVVHLTNSGSKTTSFVTSKSSEMNVSWPDEAGDVKEVPIPEQFMHTLVNGSVTSQVSDLYH